MSNETRDKVLRIMELAMLINPSSTQKKLTGDKPTVFVWLSGHRNCLRISVHPEGWEPDYDINHDIEDWEVYFGNNGEGSKKTLDKVIKRLEEIYKDINEGEI